MSTLLDVIAASLTEIGQLGRGQTASPEDGALGLRQANLLLSRRSTQRLFLPYVATRQYNLISGTADYTVGPSGATFTAARPTLIESAQANVIGSNVWVPLSIWDKSKYDSIRNRAMTADVPDGLYPEYTSPNLAFHVHPIPISTPLIKFGVWEQLTQFASLFDTLAFPPAYEAWLEAKLAVLLAPFYDQPVPATLIATMQETEADLQRYNAQSMGGAVSEAQRLTSPNVGQPIPTGAGAAQ